MRIMTLPMVVIYGKIGALRGVPVAAAATKQKPRTDLEVRKINGQYEFASKSSFGQEFIMDYLGLRGTGYGQSMKLTLANKEEFCEAFKMALDEGLIILGINIDTINEVV